MKDLRFHCDICDCEMTFKSKAKHLQTKKHRENLEKENEEGGEVKQCCKCHKNKGLDQFRNANATCNQCRDALNEYRRDNPEKISEWRKRYFAKIKDEVYTCPICDYEMKRYNKRQHERGVGHKHLAELIARGEEPEKPERIIIDKDGVELFKCGTCRLSLMKCEWGAHLIGDYHLKCKMANEK